MGLTATADPTFEWREVGAQVTRELAGWLVAALTPTCSVLGVAANDPTRPDITCVQLSERLLDSLGLSTPTEVQAAMQAPERPIPGGLHLLSNYGGGQIGYFRDVNFKFEHVKATYIYGEINDPKHKRIKYIWNTL